MISVIIPVYKESFGLLRSTLDQLICLRCVAEIIVVTTQADPMAAEIHRLILKHYAGDQKLITCMAGQPGRARQMNLGAETASLEILLFIHADTRLPPGADELIVDRLQTTGWGRFDLELDDQRHVFRIIAWFINIRSGLTHICTGDQALFMTRYFFDRVGGFPLQDLMEDIEFSIRAKKISLPAVINKPVVTSARRWQQGGIIKTVCLMWCLRALYWLGMPASELAKLYRQAR